MEFKEFTKHVQTEHVVTYQLTAKEALISKCPSLLDSEIDKWTKSKRIKKFFELIGYNKARRSAELKKIPCGDYRFVCSFYNFLPNIM